VKSMLEFIEKDETLNSIHRDKINFTKMVLEMDSLKLQKDSVSIQNTILQSLSEEPEMIFKELLNLIKKDKIKLKDLLLLLVMIYSSVDPSVEFEILSELKFEMFQYFINKRPQDSFLKDSLRKEGTLTEFDMKTFEMEIEEFLTSFIHKLELIKSQRESFQEFRNLYQKGSDEIVIQPSLVMNVCEFIEGEKNIVDLHRSRSLLQSLKNSSFGFFSSFVETNTNQFTSNNYVIFVVGGVTLNEISKFNIMKKGNKNILFGSNAIIQPEDILREILLK
jgi:hypothetical protein